jgi:hypothetical protein
MSPLEVYIPFGLVKQENGTWVLVMTPPTKTPNWISIPADAMKSIVAVGAAMSITEFSKYKIQKAADKGEEEKKKAKDQKPLLDAKVDDTDAPDSDTQPAAPPNGLADPQLFGQ